MRKLTRFLFLGLTLALVASMALPVAAQEAEPPAGPGEGGIIIEGSTSDPGNFHPFYCASTSCLDDGLSFMMPGLIGVDPATATFVKGGDGAMALDWEVAEDGTTFTFTLREDMFWNDGVPVTAHDWEWSWDVNANPEANTQQYWITDYVDDIVALDDYTLQVTLKFSGCNVLRYTDYMDIAPAHVFEGVALTELEDHPYSQNPDVTSGVFQFGEFRPGEQFSLIANQEYPDTTYGYVVPAGRIVRNVPNATVLKEQFLAGELNAISNVSAIDQDEVREAAEADPSIQVYEFAGNTWDYFGFNLADPANPQDGLDAEGNPIPQDPHPLFGDVRVRQAIAKAIDVDAIIEGAVFGNGARMPSSIVASSWAIHPELDPIAYDPEGALELLAEAGFVPGDDGMLVATEDAMYVEAGTPLTFQLLTNEGNTRREAIGTLIQDQLRQIGIQVDYQAIDWNTLLEINDSQEYDAVIMGWRAGYPDDPIASISQVFGPGADVVGACSNCGSYYNQEVLDLLDQANTVEGCATEDMAPYLWQVQEIMQDEVPYVWLFAQNGMYAVRDTEGFSPYPAQMYWNVDAWAVTAD